MWKWPLKASPLLPGKRGSFGAVRTYDIHTGVDLYCEIGTEVVAVEDGEVISIENFTGPNADDPSPWWNDTKAILVRGESGVVLYGECEPRVKVGDLIVAGQVIASIEQSVIRKFKGRPMVMLHLELMHPEANKSMWWKLEEPQPDLLEDPTVYLTLAAMATSDLDPKIRNLLEDAHDVIRDHAPGFTVLLEKIDNALLNVKVFSLETYDGNQFRN